MIGKIKQYLPDVIAEVNDRLSIFKSVVEYDALSTKLKSELISNMFEASFAKVVPNTLSPCKDNEPDLYIDNTSLEIKTAKTTNVWRGGEYSKRESDYLLVSYDDSNKDVKWFVLHSYLFESDWKSSASDSYYATTIDIDDIVKHKEYEILIGDTIQKRVKTHLKCA